MMKLWDKIKSSIHPEDEEGAFDDEFDDDYPITGGNVNSSGSMGDMGDIITSSGGYSSGNPVYGNPSQNINNSSNNSNNMQTGSNNSYQPQVQNMPVSSGGLSVSSGREQYSVELRVVKPENYESVASIADLLISGKTVVLNLEETNKEIARRLLDFLKGVAYAIKGNWKAVSEKTYIITPSNAIIAAEHIQDKGERRDNPIY